MTAKVDTYMRMRITCFDDALRELTWSPESRRHCRCIVVSGCSVDSSNSEMADTQPAGTGTKRLEFDVYGYVFLRNLQHTRVYHMNHIGKGLKLNILQSIVNVMTRKRRNKEACKRELERLRKFEQLCVERQRDYADCRLERRARDYADKS